MASSSNSASTSSSSWFPWNISSASKRAADEQAAAAAEQHTKDEVLHRKRLAAILRYIASMHQALRGADGSAGPYFVRDMNGETTSMASDFFQSTDRNNSEDDANNNNGGMVLFSTNDFRRLIVAEASMEGGSSSLWSSPPFSFYATTSATSSSSAAAASLASRKRSFATTLTSSLGYGSGSTSSKAQQQQQQQQRGHGLWLRLTRLGPNSIEEQPEMVPVVEKYLKGWLQESAPRGCRTVQDLLTLHHLERAPGIPSSTSGRHVRLINSFLKRYKRFLRMKLYQQTLEPIYNRLFEWIQQQNEHNEELVWGLGHAKLQTADGRLINGPLLEVLVEVELAPDGAVLVRPREHTGVALNREVVSALVSSSVDPFASASLTGGGVASSSVVSQLHRTVGDMESTQLAPGQPSTYVSLLKRIAVEISPGGAFQASSTSGNKKRAAPSKLMVSEAWCLYTRSKPSSVWARDANLLADRIGLPNRIHDPLPMATWSLTHGPSKLEELIKNSQGKYQPRQGQPKQPSDDMISRAQADVVGGGIIGWLGSNFFEQEPSVAEDEHGSKKIHDGTLARIEKPIFPLASSDSQHRIADLLLRHNYPAVLAEGPPGSGKTHTIANIVCAYLCQGKRVLVTSKNANALNVLRGRLPKSVQELCVDVTMSELQGMRQLQQTVERLAIRVSAASSEIETEKCGLLQRSIDNLEAQLEDIDQKLTSQSERLRHLLHQPSGVKLMEKSSDLIQNSPWLMQTIHAWNLEETESIFRALRELELGRNDPILTVGGFDSPPYNALISTTSAKSGSTLSSLASATRNAVASLPVVGSMMDAQVQRLNEDIARIRINNRIPESEGDWKTVTKALKHALAVHTFQHTIWRPLVVGKGWPERSFDQQSAVYEMSELLEASVDVKRLQHLVNAEEETESIAKFKEMDEYRARLAIQIQHHSEELADAAVVAELSRSFSPDAQSALIRFSQIAGTAKFNKTAKPSKMTARQRRRRQEYLDAFDRCCRFIPCWILTTSQISDYLPAECLFDLVVIDECSQSDVTVLPGMMRGKQWLIVGDGKQVSPTESFVSEDDIDNLRATLPPSPLEDALLPGRSFFDLCAQAFPQGRVVLSEHFRCAPEIIQFSNSEFYDGRLVPLRLPKKGERLTPSLIDVRVRNGAKIGKVNEREADKIVQMICEMMDANEGDIDESPRSIGVISLIGDEQSRLIRGRLLDACGPEKLARHDVLIGDPPSFQGAERDVVFLSMVCSRGSCPTQNQQFHFQRANVAMSRARDRCVLVRSIDLKDIPSMDDAKVPIIEFFMQANVPVNDADARVENTGLNKSDKKRFGSTLLYFLLSERGYHLVDMGVVWKDAICIEHSKSDTRVAVMVDCEESSQQEWSSMFAQQKAIERVGWKCLRVDALSLVVDFASVVNGIVKFLSSCGIPEPDLSRDNDEEDQDAPDDAHFDDVNNDQPVNMGDGPGRRPPALDIIEIEEDDDVVAISSEDEDRKPAAIPSDTARPDSAKSALEFDQDDNIEASRFGEVVDMNFLLHHKSDEDESDDDDDDDDNDNDNDRIDEDGDSGSASGKAVSGRQNVASKKSPSRSSPPLAKKLRPYELAAGQPQAFKKRAPIALRERKAEQESEKDDDAQDAPSDEEEADGLNARAPSDEESIRGATSTQPQKRQRLNKSGRDRTYYPGGVGGGGEWDDADSEEESDVDASQRKKGGDEDDESWQEEDDNSAQQEDHDIDVDNDDVKNDENAMDEEEAQAAEETKD